VIRLPVKVTAGAMYRITFKTDFLHADFLQHTLRSQMIFAHGGGDPLKMRMDKESELISLSLFNWAKDQV